MLMLRDSSLVMIQTKCGCQIVGCKRPRHRYRQINNVIISWLEGSREDQLVDYLEECRWRLRLAEVADVARSCRDSTGVMRCVRCGVSVADESPNCVNCESYFARRGRRVDELRERICQADSEFWTLLRVRVESDPSECCWFSGFADLV